MNPIKVLLADDHDVVRKGMKMLLEDEEGILVIGEAADGAEAIDKVKILMPDVVILDLTMPKMTGIEAAAVISQEYPSVKILIFSMHNNREYIINSVENGASGYLLKDTGKDELLRALTVVSEGRKYFHPKYQKSLLMNYWQKISQGVHLLKASLFFRKLRLKSVKFLTLSYKDIIAVKLQISCF
jgi:DNA-binding NarL/FixJ family response regulator